MKHPKHPSIPTNLFRQLLKFQKNQLAGGNNISKSSSPLHPPKLLPEALETLSRNWELLQNHVFTKIRSIQNINIHVYHTHVLNNLSFIISHYFITKYWKKSNQHLPQQHPLIPRGNNPPTSSMVSVRKVRFGNGGGSGGPTCGARATAGTRGTAQGRAGLLPSPTSLMGRA